VDWQGLNPPGVPGIWATSDVTHPLAQVARAMAGDSNSAIAITQDLVASQPHVGGQRRLPESDR
jgi:hypothetical protein